MIIKQIKSGLSLFVNTERAKIMQGFFKTKAGEYGEGDIFIGITIAQIRKIVKQYYKEADFKIIAELLHSAIYEERSLALYILTEKFQKTKNQNELDQIIDFYINPINLKWINNWDLVDISCYKILGKYIFNSPQKIDILYNFVKSDNLWEKRIAIVSTLAFIKESQFEYTIDICEKLLNDKHNLIHKAIGWILREVGKKQANPN